MKRIAFILLLLVSVTSCMKAEFQANAIKQLVSTPSSGGIVDPEIPNSEPDSKPEMDNLTLIEGQDYINCISNGKGEYVEMKAHFTLAPVPFFDYVELSHTSINCSDAKPDIINTTSVEIESVADKLGEGSLVLIDKTSLFLDILKPKESIEIDTSLGRQVLSIKSKVAKVPGDIAVILGGAFNRNYTACIQDDNGISSYGYTISFIDVPTFSYEVIKRTYATTDCSGATLLVPITPYQILTIYEGLKDESLVIDGKTNLYFDLAPDDSWIDFQTDIGIIRLTTEIK